MDLAENRFGKTWKHFPNYIEGRKFVPPYVAWGTNGGQKY